MKIQEYIEQYETGIGLIKKNEIENITDVSFLNVNYDPNKLINLCCGGDINGLISICNENKKIYKIEEEISHITAIISKKEIPVYRIEDNEVTEIKVVPDLNLKKCKYLKKKKIPLDKFLKNSKTF